MGMRLGMRLEMRPGMRGWDGGLGAFARVAAGGRWVLGRRGGRAC